MSRTWLVLDMSSLGHRAMHTTGMLQHGDVPTGVIFGILREMRTLADRFQTEHFAFCFDVGQSLREIEFPTYKLTRRKKKRTPEELAMRESMHYQLTKLRREHLEALGYENVFFQDGYEADDLIAVVVAALPKKDKAVLVSGDTDLYQLISERVSVYHPQGQALVNFKRFTEEWPIHPIAVKEVKAIAGCKTDDVAGVEGVGNILASQYLANLSKLPKATRLKIIDFCGTKQFKDNLKLVSLPYPGTKPVELIVHEPPTAKVWNGLCKSLGIGSLVGRGPG